MFVNRFMRLIPAAVAVLGFALPSRADTVRLKWLASGASKLTAFQPQRADLSETQPDAVKTVPDGMTNPLFGTIDLGPKEQPTHIGVVLDPAAAGTPHVYVDANGDGNLAGGVAPEWTIVPYKGGDGADYSLYAGAVTVHVRYGSETLPVRLSLLRYDRNDPARAGYRNTLLYSADYGREGSLTLGGKAYHVLLADSLTKGDFRGTGREGASGVFLFIDVNGNGAFDSRGEAYDVSEPFNIAGTTYEIHGLTPSGDSFEIVKSQRSVAEILPPPDLSVGKIALPFEQRATNGATIRFPADYRGKLVLLYFWATWCPVCNGQVPFVTRAYEKFHGRGLEIVGISLDHPDAKAILAAFTHKNSMPWPQIYDGKGYQSEIPQLYYVRHTPTAYLVNGDTGEILATGPDLRGDPLSATIQKFIRK